MRCSERQVTTQTQAIVGQVLGLQTCHEQSGYNCEVRKHGTTVDYYGHGTVHEHGTADSHDGHA